MIAAAQMHYCRDSRSFCPCKSGLFDSPPAGIASPVIPPRCHIRQHESTLRRSSLTVLPIFMSSFQQLKSSRDKRHTTAKQFARDVNQRNGGATSDQAIHKYVVKAEQTSVAAEVSTSVGRHDVPAGLEVKTILGRGRGLFATKIYRPGRCSVYEFASQAHASQARSSLSPSRCRLFHRRQIYLQFARPACLPPERYRSRRGDQLSLTRALNAASFTIAPPSVRSVRPKGLEADLVDLQADGRSRTSRRMRDTSGYSRPGVIHLSAPRDPE